MPTNLHAIIRYRTIDKCLERTHKKWSRQTLSEECGKALREKINSSIDNPSIRTIQYDIDNMKSGRFDYHAPIAFDKKRKSYYYTDPNFSIRHNPLNKEDKEELQYALTILKQFKGFQHTEDLERIIAKLEFSNTLRKNPKKKVIEFEEIINPESEKWLTDSSKYIEEEICLSITYEPFEKDSFETVLSPYLLKEYNNRWFLFGWEHKQGKIRNYPLDRIKSIDPMPLEPFISEHFPILNEKINQVIGVSFADDSIVEEIRFLATRLQSKYIKTKPLHHSQTILEETESGAIFSYQLIINFELKSKLLSLGENIEILSPLGLRAEFTSRVSAMQKIYNKQD